jgi:fructose-bisphosphate aldolase class II
MPEPTSLQLMNRALAARTVIPAFNIPYLPMIEPVIQALRDCNCFGFIAVARLEFVKFEARSLQAVREEYEKFKLDRFTRLHLDHVPVVDEDLKPVPYLEELARAVDLGYDSIMVDGSRLSLDENLAATRKTVEMAHAKNIAVEGELGAVLGHGTGPMPSYEELFESGQGFTDPEEAGRFVRETGVDWLSVAVGSVHGAISAARKDEKKVTARLNLSRLDRIFRECRIPLVLHGGTGIEKACILESLRHGIAKINIATAIRQPYERNRGASIVKAKQAVYDAMQDVIRRDLERANSAPVIHPPASPDSEPPAPRTP